MTTTLEYDAPTASIMQDIAGRLAAARPVPATPTEAAPLQASVPSVKAPPLSPSGVPP